MSGKPNDPQIDQLRAIAQKADNLRDERTLQQGVRDTVTKRIEEIDDEMGKCHQEIHRLLTQMDLTQNGNFGWEHRMTFFLSRLAGGNRA